MTSFIRQLFHDKTTAVMLLISSFIIGICALAPSLFVIIVLNKYLASGVTATLLSLAAGAILLLSFEFAFRQNRSAMIQNLNRNIFQSLSEQLAKKIKDTQITGDQFKKLERAGAVIKNATNSSITAWILDWPFVLLFLIVLLYINWAASIITAIFMIVMYNLITWKRNVSMSQETQSNIEIFLNGLQTIVIMSVGAMMIIAGTLDIGLLIGSNILAARALQGTSKYAKATEFLKQRDQAVGEIINYVKGK